MDKATGPDEIPIRILKTCWKHLALPIVILTKFVSPLEFGLGIYTTLYRFSNVEPLVREQITEEYT